ncbi:amino acid adenylation domain-containing protein [Streptomyces sp. NPDC050388]|uniref:amino acid adenylation domain-containing protein n=1 Tax=Streptomyces sp. NPDC050388 TaxID=3155781 RepID=UPI003438BD37
MKHELNALIADYRAGRVSGSEVGDLLRALRQQPSQGRPAPSGSGVRTYGLSEGQHGLWALQRAYPDMAAYNVPLCFRVVDLDVPAFQEACRVLVARHPVLSTVIHRQGDTPCQSIDPGREPDFACVDLTGVTDEGEALAAVRRESKRPFVMDGPSADGKGLFRVRVFDRPADESIVLITVHHVIFDGSSARLLTTALFEAYEALRGGAGPVAPADLDGGTGAGFHDFVAEERRTLAERGGDLLPYWRDRLAEPLPVLDLPTDRPHTALTDRFAGDTYADRVPATLVARIREVAAGRRAFVSTAMLTAYAATLASYSGHSDSSGAAGAAGNAAARRELVIGMPVNERGGEELAGTMGLMINMVPVRVALPDGATFGETVSAVQRDVADDMLHSHPFSALVRELPTHTPPGRSPVFQTAFVFQDVLDGISGPDRPYELVDELHQEGEYELSLEVWGSGDAFTLYWKYQPELYSRPFIERLAERFVRVLTAVCDEPGTPLAELCERFADTAGTDEACVHELFEEAARRTPDAVAVASQEEVLTYEALSRRSDALAAYLVERGVRRNDLVAVLLDRSAETVVALLGILKAGAAFVPLDPELPVARLTDIVADSGTALIVTQARHEDRARSLLDGRPRAGGADAAPPASLLVLDEERERIAAAGPVRVEVTGDDLAYVIYTSGSTGRPKGVMIAHRGFGALLRSMRREPGMSAADTFFAVTTISFDMAQVELFLPLVSGARCYVCDSPAIKDVELLKERVARVRPTVMQATPATWSMLFHSGWRNHEGVRILCGGEALPRTLKEYFRDTGSEAWNLYGPTETTVYATGGRIRFDAPTTIGRPIADSRVHILDERLRPVAAGEAGELCVTGTGLARGYVNRPDLTAEKFIDHDLVPGGKLYRTGDLARWTEDGEIDYLGRMDFQVKIRGYRIELGDIEYHLGRHQEVAQCVVVARGADGAKQLVAYYVPRRAGAAGDPSGVFKEHLRELLPAYMVPDFFVAIDAVPLTVSGKVDRNDLMAREVSLAPPAPVAPAMHAGSRAPEAAGADAEDEVLAIWQDVLKIRDLAPTASFFEAGGNSLSAVVLADRITRRLGVPFVAADLFKYATVRSIAAHVRAVAPVPPAAPAPTAVRVPEPEPEPVSEPEAGTDGGSLPEDAVAIVGIACRFPGVRDHWEFWENLKRGEESVRRWTDEELREAGVPEHVLRDPAYVPLRSSLDGKEDFDGEFFRLSPNHVELMDPQFRQLLLHAWKAVEDAGYDHRDIPDTAVYVSTGNHFYGAPDDTVENPAAVLEDPRQYLAWVMSQSGTVASMISYQLGFGGPSMSVHSNCSSSLTALSLAARAVLTGESGFALVAAASANSVDGLGYIHQPGLNLSSDGHVKAFDADADGMVGGEGAVALLIRRASDAVADGDHIYGLLRGIATNNDGGDATGFYSPSVNGQSRLIRMVLERTGIDARSIGYVEAHGTGTKLGDPVELAALTEAYRDHTDDIGYCGIGSVKSNIGHLDTAAGLAGSVKVLLSLYHGQIPPTLHYNRPNPQLRLETSPFRVVDRLSGWPAGGTPRRAAQSSIGLGGSNAHAVFEEYVRDGDPNTTARPTAHTTTSTDTTGHMHRGAHTDKRATADSGDDAAPQLVPLSARTPDDLVRGAAELLRYLRGPRAAALRLDDLAYTLQVGRVPMACRVAFVVRDPRRLAAELEAFVQDPSGDGSPRRFTGRRPGSGARAAERQDATTRDAKLARRLAEGKIKKVAKAWANGADPDWSLLPRPRAVRRISLPGYAFGPVTHPWPVPARRARRELPGTPTQRRATMGGEPLARLHPLLHENVSGLDGQRYRSRLTGDEYLLADHVVGGRRLLPAVAGLEMAYTAVRRALTGADREGGSTVLKNVTWVRPVVVGDDGRDIEFTLAPERRRTREEADGSTGVGPLRFELLSDGGRSHVQGRAVTEPVAAPPDVELDRLRAGLRLRSLSGAECYAHIARAGVEYGPGFRLVRTLYRGESDGHREVLAELTLPRDMDGSLADYTLHPSFMDAAIHASLGLDPAFDTADPDSAVDGRKEPSQGATPVPFALDRLDVHAPFGRTMYAWVRPAPGQRAADAGRVLDIDLVDERGRVCATLRGLAYRQLEAPEDRPARASRLRTLLPVWEPRHPGAASPQVTDGEVLVFDSGRRLSAGLRALHPRHRAIDLPPGASIQEIARLIREASEELAQPAPPARSGAGGRIAQVVWVAPAEDPDDMIGGQERGVIEVFRIIKALLSLGHGTREMTWTAYTFGTQLVRERDRVAATHAGVHGLMGSLAREHTRWTIDLVDLPHDLSGEPVDTLLGGERRLTGVRPGTTLALRGGRWFSQELLPVADPEPAAGPYRRHGVHVVVGGAGGIGELWSRSMVERYQASIVWIGRRPLDEAVERKLAGLAERARAVGAQPPRYISADASDRESLLSAYRQIKEHHPRIDGVVHSAIVLADRTLTHMDEDVFRAALRSKVDVGVNIADVFGAEPLDFVLFFSSVESFVRAAGQANYAAGCTFKDALAHELQQRGLPLVKAVDWGYWGVTGVVSDSFYRERMAAVGVDSLDPDEALHALESFLGGEHRQVVLMRTFGDEALRGLALDERQGTHPAVLPSVRDEIVAAHRAPRGELERLHAFLPHPRMCELAAQLLFVTLRDLGARGRDGLTGQSEGLAGLDQRVLAKYARWMEESDRLLAHAGLVEFVGDRRRVGPAARGLDRDGLWRQWHAERDGWQPNENQRAQVDLVESCLLALADVLTGARQATEILFPGSSMSRVEGIYRGDPVADYFNDQLSALMADAVRAWGRADSSRRLRILEVGAGTGATSAKVLEALEPFGDRIAEYCYTDLSKAFLFRAEERLRPRYPYVTTRIFDAGCPPGQQGVEPGGFDIVVATNVLHATADISRTLRNVKAAMRGGGLLFINEMSRNTILAHLTFGLLDGWWLYRDAELRIPGSPVLAADRWLEVLEDEGFRTGAQPDTAAHALGQQLIVAESDGRFRIRTGPEGPEGSEGRAGAAGCAVPAEPAAPAFRRPAAGTTVGSGHDSGSDHDAGASEATLRAHLTAYFERLIREALHLSDTELDPHKDLHDYGLDSILVSGMNSAVAEDFEDVSSTLFFELRTLDELVEHFLADRRPELLRLFPQAQPQTSTAARDTTGGGGASLTARATAYLTGLVAQTLRLAPEELAEDADLSDLGLDSILVIQLHNALSRDFDELNSTLFFDCPTIRDVVDHFTASHPERLAEVLAGGPTEATAQAARTAQPTPDAPITPPAPEDRHAPADDGSRKSPEPASVPAHSVSGRGPARTGDIAIVGLGGRYPGADSPEELWQNLARGESATAPYPTDRWWCRWEGEDRPWGGFLANVSSFDAEYFGIPAREAAAMDPQERLFIETVHSAVQDAGYTARALAEAGRVGVFVGVMNSTYNGRTAYSSIANRTSYLFDFQGPSIAIDTACSASLTAVHLAVESLHSGDSDCAVAGGVNLLLDSDHFEVLEEHGLLSSGDRCRPFSERADGFLAAEGVGAVVLRPLADAIAAGDHIYGVVRGSAVNSGGRTSRYSMPSLTAQRDVVVRAMEKAGVTPDTISYVEAHGTATLLGDSMEVSALSRAFGTGRQGQYCAIGSLKSNLGHCESASGIAGLTKVLMQLRHGRLAPSINAQDLNTGIVFKRSPFFVQRELAPWTPTDAEGRPLPRRAGISCFGAGGSNAHLIIEEYMEDDVEARPFGQSAQETCLVPLSARTPEELRAAAGRLSHFLEEADRAGRQVPLRDLAHTLQTGRDELPVRLALVVRSTTELAGRLAEVHTTGGAGGGEYNELTGAPSRRVGEAADSGVTAAVSTGDLRTLARLWSTGATVPWRELYGARPPRRVSLPTYPFGRKEYWYEDEEPSSEGLGLQAADRPEPVPEPEQERTQAPLREAERDAGRPHTASAAAPHAREWLRRAIGEQLDTRPHDVRTDQDFPALGLSSMDLVHIARRIQRELDPAFESASLFEYTTVNQLAGHLSDAPRAHAPEPVGTPAPRPLPEAHPLSEDQQGLWALQKGAPGASAYNVPLCFRVTGLDTSALRRAFERMVVRHPVLGGVVREERGRLVLARPGAPRLAFTERELPALDRDETFALLRRHAKEPFDLDDGPLCTLTVFRTPDDESWVLLNAHHLVLDGTSAVVVVKDLLAAYRAATEGLPMPGDPRARAGYAEFVAEEAALLRGEEGAARLAYWQEQLAGPLPALAFPTDRPRVTPGRGVHGATVTRRLTAELSERIARFARTHGVYPSAAFLAAYKVLLRQYTGQDDIVVGMPVSNRTGARFDGTVGHFVTMVPVRSRMSGRQPFTDLCKDVQKTLFNGIAHSYPFGPLVRELGLGAADGSAPVFSQAFMYQDWHEDVTADTGSFTYVEGIHQEGEYELVLEVVEPHGAVDGYAVNWKYDPALFDRGTADRLLHQYVHLLETVPAAAPAQPVDDCSLVSPEELHTLTVEWNDTAVSRPERCAHELFAEQAARTPHAIALTGGAETLTYAELDERSRRLADRLRGLGVGPGSLVAVYLERSPELVVALLATMRAGGAYIPLDPTYPRDRIAYILDDAAPQVVLSVSALDGRLRDLDPGAGATGRRVLLIDGTGPESGQPHDGGAVSRETGADTDSRVTGSDPAYVIYTSGSTGNPKGVVVPHSALTNFLCAMADRPGMRADDRILAVTTHSFDIAALELYLPLITGAQCHLSDAATVRDAGRLAELIARVRPTVMQATPATWTMLLHSGWTNDERVRVLCGGEALSETLKERLAALDCEVWNLFGPTETTVWSTVARIEADQRVTIGRPIDNTRIHIVDGQGRIAPVGVPGELCIAGDGLALGYLNKPELTAERFPDNPFPPGGRMYRTGDLARWLSDGTIEYLGRMDSQVKVRGFRVELGEIEHVLTRHPAVRECAVVARTGTADGGTQLVAYWTQAPGGAHVTSRELLGHLGRSLPDYMVPAFVLPIDRLPQTPNGKVDRLTLARRPVVLPEEPAGAGAVVAPAEDDVLALWREVLGVDNLRPTDAFLEAGGNSVLAVLLADRVAKRFGVSFTAADVFRCAHARGTGAHLHTLLNAEPVPAPVPVLNAAPAAVTGPDRDPRCGPEHGSDGRRAGTTVGDTAVHAEPPAYLANSVAIIGMSVGLPGADDHHRFWRNLLAGEESVELCPPDELRRLGIDERLIQDPAHVPVRASLRGKGLFDPGFFQVSARDAELMDPQLRQLLQHSWKVIEDAGHLPGDVADAAVYMSTSNALYQAPVAGRDTRRDSEALVGFLQAQPGTIPTTISYKLGLRGPSLYVHSNCSSSLAGLALACQGILSGQTTHALVGGSGMYGENTVGYLYEEGMTLSSDGHCRPFSADATGMIGGEGAVVVLLKDAVSAVRDGDHVYALVRGVGMNNDGDRKAGYYAPSVAGQSELVTSVLDRTGVHPESVRYLEAHGTGTVIGDPIEVMAVSEAYRRHTDATGFCGIGSVKSNLGHLDAAAGLAGLVKTALVVGRRMVPPTINHDAPNPQIDFEHSPFRVVDRLTPLAPGAEPLRAAVSSFGIGGTNVHAILEEATPRADRDAVFAGPHLVPLSARTTENLRRYARDLAHRLAEEETASPTTPRLADIAFTFQVGRTALAERAAFVVHTVPELIGALRDFADRTDTLVRAGAGAAPPSLLDDEDRRGLVRQWLVERRLDKVARLWEAGEPVDWDLLYHDGPRPHRVSLPTYPFSEEYYWLSGEPDAPHATQGVPGAHATHRERVTQSADDVLEPRFFEERWVPCDPDTERAGEDGRGRAVSAGQNVVVFLTDRAAQESYRRAARAHTPGARLVFVEQASDPAASVSAHAVHRSDERSWRRVLGAVAEAHGRIDAIHYLWPTEQDGGAAALRELTDVGILVRALAATSLDVPDVLVAGHFRDAVEQAALDSLIGYERSLSGVLPGTSLRVVLHEGVADAERWAGLLLTEQRQECKAGALYRAGRRHVCRVESVGLPAPHGPSALREGGTYLITGAFGGLGRRLAEHLAGAYRANLVLLGRSPLRPADEVWVERLRRSGGEIVCRRADVTDEEALVRLLDGLPSSVRAIDGVIHAAGTAQAVPLTEKTRGAIEDVLGAKVRGTLALEQTLDRVLGPHPARFVCHFSSSSATLGDFGSCDYAVANRFQAAYARALGGRRSPHRTLAVQWPLWEEGGMGAAAQRQPDGRPGRDFVTAYLDSSGQQPLATDTGLALFERFLMAAPAAPLVLHASATRARSLVDRAVVGSTVPRSSGTQETPADRDGLRTGLAAAVRDIVAHVLKAPVEKLDDDSNFVDLGLDSIRLTQLAHRLSERLGIRLLPTVLYDHPSIGRLTGHLAEQTVVLPPPGTDEASGENRAADGGYESSGRDEEPPRHDPSGEDVVPDGRAASEAGAEPALGGVREVFPGKGRTRTDEPREPLPGEAPIAVIGMSGIFPGCRSVDEFWNALTNGKDLVTEVPPVRFGAAAVHQEDEAAERYPWLGGIDWADEFDAAFFEIAPKEARTIDPRQRHLLQESWKALEDAALGAEELKGSRVGVFVGVEQGDYQLLVGDSGSLTSNHDGVLAARLSYFLDLKGPVLTVNTSCSSGLVALHQACASLRRGECDIAVVAAANFVLTPQSLAAMNRAGMLSAEGRCATFDRRADGMVPGEAVTALVLRPLDRAEANGDPVHSVITASGINYDGRTNGITAPAGEAQRELLETVYRRGGVDPEDLGYIVTHGTGTRLGDPVEVNALREAFRPHTDKRGFCALTSTKTNVGHTFAASGLVGLICLSEALRHGTIPASLHCEQDNEYIDWNESPFYVNKSTRDWTPPQGKPRTGAVSAFGMSGTNAHVVVREYTGGPSPAAPTQPYYLLPLSAKSEAALAQVVHRLVARIASGALDDADLPRLSATLLTGRHHFRHRCAVVVSSLDEAVALWTNGSRARSDRPARTDAWFRGTVPRDFTARAADAEHIRTRQEDSLDTRLDPAHRREALVDLAQCYVEGHTIPGPGARPGESRPTRLRLPAYPFARNRYWVGDERPGPATAVFPPTPTSADTSVKTSATAAPKAQMSATAGVPRPVDETRTASSKPVVLTDLADIPHRFDARPGDRDEGRDSQDRRHRRRTVSLTPFTSQEPTAPEAAAPSRTPLAVTREHDVLEDLKSAAAIDFGGMVATLNRTGVMVEHLIPYSSDFADFAGERGGEVLDMGCAYGVASIAALERGARVVALDMEQKHLDILEQRVNDESRERLTLRQGTLPDVDFEDESFTAVHASRVLHFLDPDGVRLILRKMFRWLTPGGKVFLSTDSPYFGYWASKAADYEERKRAGDPWPGYIDDVAAHFDPAHVVGGPSLINAIDPDVFRRECEAAGFVVERAGFFGAVGVDRESYGAPGPGMEHVGIIARKPMDAPAPRTPVTPPATATLPATGNAGAAEARSADGTRIHYRVRGSGSTALVFIHGLGCDASYWDRQIPFFEERFTVIALDLAGHGRSGKDRWKWTIEAFAQDVAAVVEHAGATDVVLIGHSLGGPVMLAAAPLLGGVVQGMIGVDTLHNLDPKRLDAAQLDRFAQSFSDQPVKAGELFLDTARQDLIELVERTREQVGGEIVSAAFREMLTYLQDVPKHFDVPLVLVNSASWTPTNLAAAQRYGVEVDLVEGVGHFVMLEAPDTFNASLRRHIDRMVPGTGSGDGGRGASAEGADG